MRVLLVSDFLPPVRGGLEFHVVALARALSDHGDEVHIATLTPSPSAVAPRVAVHSVAAASSAVLPHESADRPFHPPLPDPLAHRRLSRLVRELAPDVIHAHSWLGVSLPHRNRPPLVFTAHDYGLVCQLRTLTHPDGEPCSGPGARKCVPCGAQRYASVVSALLAPGTVAGRRLLRPDAVVAVSGAVRDALAPHLPTAPTVIHNFVPDAPGAAPVRDGVLPAGRYAMFAGHDGPDKGLPDLLELWRAAPPDADLFVATTRPAAVEAPPGVRVASLTRDHVATAWSGAQLALVPSRWPEPCPTVVLEAMQAGLPVVGYAVGGIPELVRDGVDGIVVPRGDTAALRDAVTTLLADDTLRASMGRAAAERVRSFTAGAVVPRLRQLYADLCGRA